MGGLLRQMPVTGWTFIIGGLALAGLFPLAGFWSKDEILLMIGDRGGWYWILYVFFFNDTATTEIYTFRMIFRAFFGDPCPEARELESGHLVHHALPRNPATRAEADFDIGFPGPEHHIAERAPDMKVAMGVLAVLAAVGGALQIPNVTDVIDHFLEPTFADSRLYDRTPSDGLLVFGLVLGTVIGLAGIAIAYRVWVQRPGTADALRERFAALHRLFVNKWYFDELIDVLVVRPALAFGRFGQQTFERVVVNGVFVGGATGVVRAGSAAVRSIQTGFLRYYVALLVLGLCGTVLYFLIASS
jgi:NADH-quinone oxidoreductase subunit L